MIRSNHAFRSHQPEKTLSLLPLLLAFGASSLATPAIAQVVAVKTEQKISETAGGLGEVLDAGDRFGAALACLGDLDGDGIGDLAVGANDDDDGGLDQGAVWILFLNADGTVADEQKISETAGGFAGSLTPGDGFGISLAALGDHDGDGIVDLAVGAHGDDDGGLDQGAVWILFLNADGTVDHHQKISETSGGFAGTLDADDAFGRSVASLGELDGDGIGDLAVGAIGDDDGAMNQGAVWILFLNANGTVAFEQKISDTAGGFGGDLSPGDRFGISVGAPGDLDDDGIVDLAVGAHHDDDGDTDQGAVWILFLKGDGTVDHEEKISATAGGFGGNLDANDAFGFSLAALGDLNGDSIEDLAVGAVDDDDGDTDQGAVWILFLKADGMVDDEEKISETAGGFGGVLDPSDSFGRSVAWLGDLDGDGLGDLAVGAHGDDDGGVDQGAVWILFLDDTTPPTLSCPSIVWAFDLGAAGEFMYFSVTVVDDVDPSPVVVCSPPSGSYFPRGRTVVTCTATDVSGNQATCSFPVVVSRPLRAQ